MSRRPKTHERGGPSHRRRRQPQVESTADLRAPTFDSPEDEDAFWEAEGARCAIEGMDLPDGAYFSMMDEAGLEP